MNYVKAVALIVFLAVASVVGFWIWVLSYFTRDKPQITGAWDELDFVEIHGCWVPTRNPRCTCIQNYGENLHAINCELVSSPRSAP